MRPRGTRRARGGKRARRGESAAPRARRERKRADRAEPIFSPRFRAQRGREPIDAANDGEIEAPIHGRRRERTSTPRKGGGTRLAGRNSERQLAARRFVSFTDRVVAGRGERHDTMDAANNEEIEASLRRRRRGRDHSYVLE